MAKASLKPVAAAADTNEFFEHIRAFELFKACPDDFIQSLSLVAKRRLVKAGTEILAAGQANEVLYVLYSGRVEVKVEGELVATMDRPGDLIGEISALTAKTAIASVSASTDVEFIEISSRELDLHGRQDDGFGYHLYRALTGALSLKIISTNQKARQFEIANRALTDAGKQLEDANQTLEIKVQDRTAELESRNAELIASHRKLEELYLTKDITFKKLEELHATILTPVKNTIEKLEAVVQPAEKVMVEKARQQLGHAIEMLQPFSQLYSTEKAMRNKRVLLLENDRKQQMLSKMALGGSGVQLEVATTVAEGQALINSGARYDMAFVSSAMASLIPDFHRRLPSAKLIFMASCDVPSELPALREHAALISNIVSRHPEDRTFTVKNIGTTVSKLVSKNIFGMEKYLIWGAEIQSHPVIRSTGRRELIEAMQTYFAKLGIRTTISERVAAVAEELLMNAIYDAPTLPDGKPAYNHLPRTTPVELKKSEQSEFRYACDGMLVAISVSDPFGGFTMQTLLDYLERNYLSGNKIEATEKGGAGRGLHQIVVNSDLVIFNVHRGHKTEAVALFHLDPKMVVEGAKPSFHFFLE